MKKFFAFAAAAMMAITASAQSPLYMTGASAGAENGGFAADWAPEEASEFSYANGQYSLTINGLTKFKISTVKGGWDDFNAGAYTCNYGEEPGKTVALEAGDGDIGTPWKGDWTVVVAGDLSTITMTTTTEKPSDEVIIYLRGDMNGWGADDAWKMTQVTKDVFKFEFAADQSIALGQAFKIADADWNKWNIGGDGEPLLLDVETEVFNGNNPANFTLEEACNGVVWLTLDGFMLALSNDKSYVPDFYNPNTPSTELYMTGDAASLSATWDPSDPAVFKFVNGQYELEITSVSMFKISTVKGEWADFNSAALTCEYGEEPGKTVALTSGDANIVCPWAGDWKVVVAADLSTICMTTDTPAPTPGVIELYLRGDMNSWGAEDAWKFEQLNDKVFRFTFAADQGIALGEAFKIADANWSKHNFGGDGEAILLEVETELFSGSNTNLTLEEACNGVVWFTLEGNYVELSNDKTYVPDFYNGSAVKTVEVENGEAVYFNLQGVRVANPENGMFIVVKNGKAQKTVVK